MKKPLVFAFAMLAASALAAGLLLSSRGKGRTLTADGRAGSFDYSIARRTGSVTATTGSLRFEQQANANGPYALVTMGVPDVVGVSGKVCEFSGRGAITYLDHNRRVSQGGRVSVRVSDLHALGTSDGKSDTFRIRFAGEKRLTFEADGTVINGDLVATSQSVR